jgi:hypothetical protein
MRKITPDIPLCYWSWALEIVRVRDIQPLDYGVFSKDYHRTTHSSRYFSSLKATSRITPMCVISANIYQGKELLLTHLT